MPKLAGSGGKFVLLHETAGPCLARAVAGGTLPPPGVAAWRRESLEDGGVMGKLDRKVAVAQAQRPTERP